MLNLIKAPVTFDIDELRVINPRHYATPKGFDNCILCNRPVRIDAETQWIHLNTDIVAVLPDYEGDDSQGCFPIGNECCKKLPSEFVFKMKFPLTTF